jgi:Na+-translocating ferredoxin:NAD+ oxidoreductase subunit A
MSSLLLILLSAVLATLAAMTSAPRWRPFSGELGLYAQARAFAIAALMIIPTTTIVGWALAIYVLRARGLEHLQTLVLAAIAAGATYGVELVLRRRSRQLPQQPGFVLLMTTNAAALGVALLAAMSIRSLLAAASFAVVAAAAFDMLLLAFASMYERLRGADAPPAFREAPLALVTAGLIALGLMGFTGIVQE